MDCVRESLASIWIGTLRLGGVRLQGTGDSIAEAKDQLRATIDIVSKQILQLEDEVRGTAVDIRTRRATLSRPELRRILMGSKKKRGEVSSLQSKQALMEAQLDALEGNEVNKTVLSTLQSSAQALREMGLQNDLMKVDTVISELEEGMNHAHDVQSTLSTGMVQMDITMTDDELDTELAELLGEPVPTPPIPVVANAMGDGSVSLLLPDVPEASVLLESGHDGDDGDAGGVGERSDLPQSAT
jgi:hypothetical protein